MTGAAASGWDQILAEGEHLLWQGKPQQGIVWAELFHFQTYVGLIFGGLAALWLKGVLWMQGRMAPELTSGSDVLFLLVGAAIIGVALYMIIGRLFWDAYQRSRTRYALSNHAAYIATDLFGTRKLQGYTSDNTQEPVLIDANPGDIIFARERRQYTAGRRSRNGLPSTRRVETYHLPVGFRQIDNARAVFEMVKETLADKTPEKTGIN